jgi:hypothetical protein
MPLGPCRKRKVVLGGFLSKEQRLSLAIAAFAISSCTPAFGQVAAPTTPVGTAQAGSAPASAATPTKYDIEYNQGVEAYTKRDFTKASDLFWKSITDGNPTALVWLYMAHSKSGAGDLQGARKDYQSVVEIFKNTREAKAAATYVASIDVKLARSGTAGGAVAASKIKPSAASPAAGSTGGVAGGTLRLRIEIIPPREGHPRVSEQMIAIVRSAVDRLPKSVAKILDDGGAKIFIGPNIIDKWPNSLNDAKPGSPGMTLPEEPGRTYGHEIYIYERSLATQGSRELGDARSMSEIEANLLHEVGHALDDCLKFYSRDKDLRAQYKTDVSNMSQDDKDSMGYYLQSGDFGPSEACAESVSILLGGQHKDNDRFNRDFPRTQSWVKTKLKI